MPLGDFVNQLPPAVFLAVHISGFAIGAYLAWRSLEAGVDGLAYGFGLYALAEISYMTYHLDWTVFLFAHTISEVLDLAAFVIIFATAVRHLRAPNVTAS